MHACKVAGEGASHCARGGRAPLQLNGSGLGGSSTPAWCGLHFAILGARKGFENRRILCPSDYGQEILFSSRWTVAALDAKQGC